MIFYRSDCLIICLLCYLLIKCCSMTLKWFAKQICIILDFLKNNELLRNAEMWVHSYHSIVLHWIFKVLYLCNGITVGKSLLSIVLWFDIQNYSHFWKNKYSYSQILKGILFVFNALVLVIVLWQVIVDIVVCFAGPASLEEVLQDSWRKGSKRDFLRVSLQRSFYTFLIYLYIFSITLTLQTPVLPLYFKSI